MILKDISKTELTGFAGWFDVGNKEKEGFKNVSEVSTLRDAGMIMP